MSPPNTTRNQRAFSPPVGPEAAYWIGFLMADGCVASTRSQIIIVLKAGDEVHLLSFKRFLDSDCGMMHIPRPEGYTRDTGKAAPQVRFAVSGNQLVGDLASYGVVPRKSKAACALGGIEHSRDFWRGAVDGDGSFHEGKRPDGTPMLQFSLCGSEPLMRQFATYVKSVVPEWKGHVLRDHSIFRVVLSCRTAGKLITELYRDCTVALPRKLERAKRVMDLERTGCWNAAAGRAA